ncbi:hypothetical protein [Psychroserpens damuponensis]|uniref:hypothetical protein n=1 Tax=Psychroserpens damuponensis TaxID=943936 RepID=UPI00069382C7|nr:hypothetical protein [Psychroserpens damuponensis]
MIKVFTYRTELGEKEFSQTIYADSITDSITNWINHINDLKKEVYSFDQKSVESIETQFKNGKIKFQKNPNVLVYELNGKYQITYINENKKLEPDFIAELKFMTTENGGRKGYAYSGYRPIFKLTDKKEMTSANLIFNDKQKVFPGDDVVALINILWTEEFENLLYPELEFELLEPPRIIAKGKIIKIVNNKLNKASRQHRV